jgi:LCP family protein required for cell wall assembly
MSEKKVDENKQENAETKLPVSGRTEKKDLKIKHSSDVKRKIILSRIKRKILKHVWLVRIGFVALAIFSLILLIAITLSLLQKTSLGLYINLARDFVFVPDKKVEVLNGRTNILLLGKGGQSHEAPDLTDTIIFASIPENSASSIGLISLPRDIWIPELRAKLNSTYYWGNKKENGGGLKLTKSSVEEIVGQPIHYGVVIDFEGFKEIINEIGGVDVVVENTFTDDQFPIPGKENDLCDGDPEYKCRYETITFTKGIQWMDGETALKFVRSRHAEGDEGTDIARATRQQRLISAIKQRILSKDILLSPKKLLQLKTSAGKYVETDLDAEAVAVLARRIFNARENIGSYVLTEELLENPPASKTYDNLYVFVPKNSSWDEVHIWVDCLLNKNSCS